MKEPTHTDVLDALKSRSEWERRQATWYQMRHDGLRRRNKPWPNAADMHFPLADMLIEKLKPTYIAQVYATDTIASFVAQSAEHAAYQTAAGQFFDYILKQQTNFEDALPIGIDTMLQAGKTIVKVLWDAERKQLQFEPVNPINIIVPAWTENIESADWIVHVQTYSQAAYRRLPGFEQKEELIKAITGSSETDANNYDASKYQREGITKPSKGDQIIVWEHFIRQQDNSWLVKTYSPNRPDAELRSAFTLPYAKGVFASKIPPPPFAELNCEVKERGYYTTRGIPERVMAFEVSLCKDWNTIKDYQTLTCSPMFAAPNGGVPQNANLRMVPGQIMPFAIEAVSFPPIPVDIAASMNGTRQLAEQLIAIPDAGVVRQDGAKEKRTAAEVNLIGTIMGRNDDLRSRIFRRELAHLLNLAWGIVLQYKNDSLEYFADTELQKLDQAALMGTYRIEPNGSGDNMNRGLVLQKAIARKQLFTNNPNINQLELDKSVIEADDPRLVKRLVMNQGTQAAMQQEDQAQEITIMLLGFPAEVRPTDDDWAHIQSCTGFVQRRATTGEPLTPETLNHLALHIETHLQALKKKQPPVFQEKAQGIQQLITLLRQEAKAGQAPAIQPAMPGPAAGSGQPIAGPGNVIPMEAGSSLL